MDEDRAKILVVDDETDLEEIIRWRFRSQAQEGRWSFDFARDGQEALQKVAESGPFDIVVTDLRMPVLDGFGLLRELHRTNPEQVTMVVSAYSDLGNIRRAMNEGAVDFLTKPIDLRDLEQTLERALETVRQRAQARRVEAERREAEAVSQAKSRFLADMSHELRTPLNAIILYGELVTEEIRSVVRPQDLADLGKILAAARHLRTLIDDVLDLSRIEARKVRLSLETFDIETVVAEVAGVLEREVSKLGNRFTWQVAADAGRMRADPTRVRQGLYNLLSNAAKFTSQGEIRLEVARIAEGNGAGAVIDFQVSDTGPGMSPEEVERLFKPFMQGPRAHKHGGTGLGLAITRMVCEAMGGSLTVDSRPGRGSTFRMRVPVEVRWDAETEE